MTAANTTPTRYREVSVADVDVELTQAALTGRFLGREAYRRTRFIVTRHGLQTALVEITKASDEPLFSPITGLRLLAGPDECRFVHAPDTDTAVPSQLAATARNLGGGARCVVVQGRYEHVSFLLDPAPLRVRVVETIPPEPPKLVHQLRRILDLADELPPVEIEPVLTDLRDLAAQHPAERYLLPCHAGGAAGLAGRVDYLDERPSRADWVLVGCARSREIHRWCYGDEPPTVDTCPRALVTDTAPTLTKCCLLEERISVDGRTVCVPWGASLQEVKAGLSALTDLMRDERDGQRARA